MDGFHGWCVLSYEMELLVAWLTKKVVQENVVNPRVRNFFSALCFYTCFLVILVCIFISVVSFFLGHFVEALLKSRSNGIQVLCFPAIIVVFPCNAVVMV